MCRFGNADARLRQRSRMSPSEKPREEGKDLSVKLFIVVVAVLLVVASMAAADGRAYTHGGPGLTTRPCGYLSVGKGWRVHATRNVGCVSARKLVRSFFSAPRCLAAQRHPGTACTVGGYRCIERALPDDVGLVHCTRPGRLVAARSNH